MKHHFLSLWHLVSTLLCLWHNLETTQAKSQPWWNHSSRRQLIWVSFFLSTYFFCISSDFYCCLFACLNISPRKSAWLPCAPNSWWGWYLCQASMLSISLIQFFTWSWTHCRQHQWFLLWEYSTQRCRQDPHIQSQIQYFLLPPWLVLAAGCPKHAFLLLIVEVSLVLSGTAPVPVVPRDAYCLVQAGAWW